MLRFRGYGWHVIEVGEIANDLDALERALREGMAETERPSVIVLRSHIGWPSPKYTDTAKAHGEAIGQDADEVRAIKEMLGLAPDEHFVVPDDVLDYYRAAGVRGRGAAKTGSSAAPRGATPSRDSPRTTRRASRVVASRGGRASCRPGRRASRSRPARPAPTRSTRSPTSCPVWSEVARTSPGTPAPSCRRTPRPPRRSTARREPSGD